MAVILSQYAFTSTRHCGRSTRRVSKKTQRQSHRKVETMTPDVFQPLNRYFDTVYVLSLPHAKARQDNIVKVRGAGVGRYFGARTRKTTHFQRS